MNAILDSLRAGLIVSCQATDGSPLDDPNHMTAMALSAERAGAVAIRANGPEHVRSICERVRIPVIGIFKRRDLDPNVYITPRFEDAKAVLDAGARIVALDGTKRVRPGGETFPDIVRRIRAECDGALIMADVSTLDEGEWAASAGADMVATTLSGYTDDSKPRSAEGPDLDLVEALARTVDVPVICEGRVGTPDEAARALARGASAVVVGTAITNPEAVTTRFVRALTR